MRSIVGTAAEVCQAAVRDPPGSYLRRLITASPPASAAAAAPTAISGTFAREAPVVTAIPAALVPAAADFAASAAFAAAPAGALARFAVLRALFFALLPVELRLALLPAELRALR